MSILINKQVVETKEVELPAFFKDQFNFFQWCINTDGIIIQVSRSQLNVWYPGTPAYEATMQEIGRTSAGNAEDFDKAYHDAMKRITVAYEQNLVTV